MINLTQHKATADQKDAGVVDIYSGLSELLTFNTIPTQSEMALRAEVVADLAIDHDSALIGGAPFFMPHLTKALKARGITPYYAFSKREVIEKTVGNTTTKTAIFKHIGFVEG